MPRTQDTELKNVGLKATLPRLKVLDILRSSPSRHLSAEDVYRRLLEQGSDVGLATVYRVLSQLETAGLLSRNVFDTGKAVFEITFVSATGFRTVKLPAMRVPAWALTTSSSNWALPPNAASVKAAPAKSLPNAVPRTRLRPCTANSTPARFSLPAPSRKAKHGTHLNARWQPDSGGWLRLVDLPQITFAPTFLCVRGLPRGVPEPLL